VQGLLGRLAALMAILQDTIITQAAATWSGSFGSNVSASSSVFLLADAAAASGTISSSAPTFAGSSVSGSSQLWGKSQGSTNVVYSTGWLMPNVAGGSAAVALTVTGGGSYGSGATGLWGIEASGLGASPTVVTGTPGGGSSASWSSGATGSASRSGVAVGLAVGFGIVASQSGGGWTNMTQMTDQYGIAGYQLVSSGTVTYSGTLASSGDWAAGAAIVEATAAAASSLLTAVGIV
jgi:hypothetical protein